MNTALHPRRAAADPASVGLPPSILACLFDLDGVLTRTADLHAAAWKEMFDTVLRERAVRQGAPFVPFDRATDYTRYVDGMSRLDGARSFLASRGIELPEGAPDDPPTARTVAGLANRKNEIVLSLLRQTGVRAYEGSVRYLHAAREAGLRLAVVSASANCGNVLAATGIADLFEALVDGVVAKRRHLRGKPAPDTFMAAAEALRVPCPAAAVFEDSLAGISAARAGGFGFAVGVDRTGQAEALRARGADRVVTDLGELIEAGQ